MAAFYKFKKESEVISLANDTPLGLAAYFFSKDVSRCWRVAEALKIGMVDINRGLYILLLSLVDIALILPG